MRGGGPRHPQQPPLALGPLCFGHDGAAALPLLQGLLHRDEGVSVAATAALPAGGAVG